MTCITSTPAGGVASDSDRMRKSEKARNTPLRTAQASPESWTTSRNQKDIVVLLTPWPSG